MNSDLSKLSQFLGSNNHHDFYLGIELLKATRNADLIAEIISGASYISYRVGFPMVPFFQENPDIWEAVKSKIPKFKADDIVRFLPHRILFLKNSSISAFCDLVNKLTPEYFKDFPLLSEAILTESENHFCCLSRRGNTLKDNFGWTFFAESRDVGPAEVIHEEEWRATAQNGDSCLKFEYFESGGTIPKMWMEIHIKES
jgi:hypothetical protein